MRERENLPEVQAFMPAEHIYFRIRIFAGCGLVRRVGLWVQEKGRGEKMMMMRGEMKNKAKQEKKKAGGLAKFASFPFIYNSAHGLRPHDPMSGAVQVARAGDVKVSSNRAASGEREIEWNTILFNFRQLVLRVLCYNCQLFCFPVIVPSVSRNHLFERVRR